MSSLSQTTIYIYIYIFGGQGPEDEVAFVHLLKRGELKQQHHVERDANERERNSFQGVQLRDVLGAEWLKEDVPRERNRHGPHGTVPNERNTTHNEHLAQLSKYSFSSTLRALRARRLPTTTLASHSQRERKRTLYARPTA